MRLRKGLLNSLIGMCVMLINGLFSMVKISLFISFLGNEINGFNNVIAQIFNFLMIGEAGLGLSTTTLLYKPIADNDKSKVNKLVAGGQQSIQIIVGIILLVAAIISLFIPMFIKNNTFNNIFVSIAFLLFALKALIPQLTQPMKSYAMANQDEYIVNLLRGIATILINCIEIYAITLGFNYLLVLLSGVGATIFSEVIALVVLKRKYKFINIFNKEKDFSATKHMKELVKVNVVSTVAKSVDPIIISKFIGLVSTSFYSNYSYIQNFLQSIIGTLLGSLTHIFGDMFAKEEEDIYEKFNMYIMISNFIASTVSILFFILIQVFVPIWVGKEALLSNNIALLFSILIYMYSIMRPMNTLVVTNRFFDLASKSALYETLINLTLSIILVYKFGISGVLWASIISFLCASFWYFPTRTYTKVFNKSHNEYFKRQASCFFVLLVMYVCCYFILYNIKPIYTFLEFIIMAIVLGLVFGIINFIIYYIMFREFKLLIINLLKKIKRI